MQSFLSIELAIVSADELGEVLDRLKRRGTMPRMIGAEFQFRNERCHLLDFGATRISGDDVDSAILESYRKADQPARRNHSFEQPAEGGVAVAIVHSKHGRKTVWRHDGPQSAIGNPQS